MVIAPSWSIEKPPISLALLSASLKSNGHGVSLFDLNHQMYLRCKDEYKDKWRPEDDLYWKDPSFVNKFIDDHPGLIKNCIEQILDSKARIIGFSVYYPNQLMTLKIAKFVKAKDKEKTIILGGPQCMRQVAGMSIVREESIDAIVVNEGDESIVEVADMLESKGRLGRCPGVLFKQDGNLIDSGDRPPIMDLDALPFADFSDFTPQDYLSPGELPILVSRGCIWNCQFCTAKIPWQAYRSQSGERMFKEVSYQLAQYPWVNRFTFHDCLINGNIEALEKFCELTIEEKSKGKMRNFQWWCQGIIRPEMSKPLLQKMKLAGCSQMTYGIESGSQKVVNLMGKRFDIQVAHGVIKNTHDSGIEVTAIFMFGFPGEKREDFADTLKFIEEGREYIDATIPAEGFCVIERHSGLYRNAKSFGLYLNPHPFYWKSCDGENTYTERFARFEAFCRKAKGLGLRLVGSYDKNIMHKEAFFKEYNDYSGSIDLNICAGLIKKESDDKIRFTWELHPECNFSCPYCEKTQNVLTRPITPQEWGSTWKRVHDIYGSVGIFITGGEPLLYPNFAELVKKLSSFHDLTISTNLSEGFDKIVSEFDPRRVAFSVNFHPAYPNFEVFRDRCLLLKRGGFSLAIYYLAYPSQVKLIPDLVREFAGAGLEFKITGFWGIFEGKAYPEGYNEEEEKILMPYLGDKKRMLYNLEGESPKGKLCNAGYRQAVIKTNGEAIRCRWAPQESLGNIYDGSFALFPEPNACNKEFCPYNEFDTVISGRGRWLNN